LRTTEATNKKKESSNQRADRENQANLKTYRDIVDKLNETEVCRVYHDHYHSIIL
jgi:hypothetical protein